MQKYESVKNGENIDLVVLLKLVSRHKVSDIHAYIVQRLKKCSTKGASLKPPKEQLVAMVGCTHS